MSFCHFPNYFGRISCINFVSVKNFHTKNNTSRNRRVFGHNKNDFNEDDSTIFSYFIKLSSATVFVISAFALTEFWKSMIDSMTDFFQSIQTPGRGMSSSRISDFVGVTVLVIGTNVATFLLWQAPNLRDKMMKYATVTRNASIAQMLFGAFSHASFFHIFINMYVLLSFIRAWEHYSTSHRHSMPQDLMSPEKFLAFYLSAGVVASAGSCIVQAIGKYSYSSLGASGAVLGLVGYICSKVPDGKLSIAFLPQYSFSARDGVIGMAIFDTAGLIIGAATRWKYMIFDHAAHLSGLLFGLWYASYGEVMLYRWSDYCRRKKDKIFGKR